MICSPGHLCESLPAFAVLSLWVDTPCGFQNSSRTRTVPSVHVCGLQPSQWPCQDLPSYRLSLQGLTLSSTCQEDWPLFLVKAVLGGEQKGPAALMCPGLGGRGTSPSPSQHAVLLTWRSLCVNPRVCNLSLHLPRLGSLLVHCMGTVSSMC